ncbi:hypothetical protein [Cohnella sp. AR92]|uniref:hypothetical protein n=1 Tax=Cohnella sp. AR92 TaxID=648716 RepID=UPI000F8D601F|nr:hypothetical protein [Cohnella sp. AR92]RUS44978.1 hypothetical protein ELR57_22245 [Cohnella sp. AR92]
MRRWVLILAGAWVVIMVLIIVLPKLLSHGTTKESLTPTPSPVATTALDSQVIAEIPEPTAQEGPIEGESAGQREKLEDVVGFFFELINEGRLDDAATMIDANYMLDLMAKDKPASRQLYMQDYVHLFEPGELLKTKVKPLTKINHDMSCEVELKLKGDKTLKLTLGLSEMIDDHSQEKLWYFTSLETK